MFDVKKLTAAGVFEAAQIAMEVLAFLDDLVGAPGQASKIATVVTAVFKVLREYRDGHVSADTVRAEMARLKTEFANNDAAADAALRKKFGMEDPS